MRPTDTSIGAEHVIDHTNEGFAQGRQRMSPGTSAILEERPRR